ncbi:MAG: biopolymer transporter ExbD [Planctomycetota bacterium]
MTMLRVPLEEEQPLNMTPIIDVVFNLLIFFLLGSTYLNEERELELQLPQVAAASPLTEAPEEINVNVRADGSASIQGEAVSLQALEERLVAAQKNYPDQAVAIRGDGRVRYDAVANVIAVCRRAGIRQLDVLVQEQQ